MDGKGRNFLTRTVVGVIFVAVVLAAMLLSYAAYVALLALIAMGCSLEFRRIAKTPLQKITGVFYIVLCMAAMGFFPVIGTGMSGPEGVGFLLSGGFDGPDARIAPAFIAVVWANDIFAYLVGVSIGRHKMAPRISPHKSWEGFAGGIVGATVVSALAGRFLVGGDVWLWTGFGLVVALAAVGGDLVESSLKRAAGVKDSGRMLPGHGGLLDRFDATLGAVPVAFLFFLLTYFLTR